MGENAHLWRSDSMSILIGTVWLRLAGRLTLNAAVGEKDGTMAHTREDRASSTHRYLRQAT